eukprot:scaffold96246_cov72-Phaeocystis_antarctica.AAC.1
MLTDERRSARHPGAASMQLHGTARHCRLLCQSLRALKSCATLAPSPPHSRRMMPGYMCVRRKHSLYREVGLDCASWNGNQRVFEVWDVPNVGDGHAHGGVSARFDVDGHVALPMAVGEAAVCLGVDLSAGTKVDKSIKVSRAAAGTARVERCVENS